MSKGMKTGGRPISKFQQLRERIENELGYLCEVKELPYDTFLVLASIKERVDLHVQQLKDFADGKQWYVRRVDSPNAYYIMIFKKN